MRVKLVKKMFNKTLSVTVFGFILGTLGSIVDGLVISRVYGVNSMAAYGISSPLYLICAAFGGLIMSGFQNTAAKSRIKADREKTNTLYSISFIVTVVIGLLFTIILLVFNEPIVSLLGANTNDEIFFDAKYYVIGISLSVVPLISNSVVQPATLLNGKNSKLFISIIALLVVNSALDLLNAYIFGLGMLGMGLATSVSYYVVFLILFIPLLNKNNYFQFKLSYWNYEDFKKIIQCGIPSVILRFSNTLRIISINYILLAISSAAAVAAFSTLTNLNNIIASVAIAGGSVTLLLTGIVIGDEDRTSVKNLLKVSSVTILVLCSFVAIVVIIFAPQIAYLYLEDDVEAVQMATQAIILFAISVPLFGFNLVWSHYLQGSGHLVFSGIVNVLDNYICVIAFAVLLSFPFGVTGVWLAFPVGEIAVMVILYIGSCIISGKLITNLNDIALLPKNFDVDDKDKIELTLNNIKQACIFSSKVFDFCLNHNLSKSIAGKIALSLEEMTAYTIKNGFNDKKKHHIDARILLKNNKTIVIALRDDCKVINPDKIKKEVRTKDTFKNIGVRMIYSMVTDLQYTRTMDMNHSVLRLLL